MAGKGKLKCYASNVDWINDMDSLLTTHYPNETFKQMNCVYVQPCSRNWVNASTMIYNQLTDLENQAKTMAIVKINSNLSVATASIDSQLAAN